jgi:hypothetical protein
VRGVFPFEMRHAAASGGAVPPEFVSLFFRPFGAESVPTRYPRLAPLALILRRFAAISSWAQSCAALTSLKAGFRGYFEALISLSNSRSCWRYKLLRDSHRFTSSSRHCGAGLSHIAAARLRRGTVLSSENICNLFIISMVANSCLGNPAISLTSSHSNFYN